MCGVQRTDRAHQAWHQAPLPTSTFLALFAPASGVFIPYKVHVSPTELKNLSLKLS